MTGPNRPDGWDSPVEDDTTRDLLAFLDASPTSWHAAEAAARRLDATGFTECPLDEPFPLRPTRHYVRRGGSLVAWRMASDVSTPAPLRIAAAHTDSPGLRIKPSPESVVAGCVRLGVEVYGGPLLNSWLDRDLGLAGRVLVGAGADLDVRPVLDTTPVLRIPQLAIHLDRGVNDTGLKLDRQQHLQPLWGLATPDAGSFRAYVAALADVDVDAVRGWDLVPFDLTPARLCGPRREFLASARLDDLLSSHAAISALVEAAPDTGVVAVAALVDHEEVGSTSTLGADGRFLPSVIERILATHGSGRAESLATLARSHAVSLDMAHATHPNHPERHDPSHPVLLDGGPVVKHNAQQRYATSLESLAPFLAACDATGVGVQHFVSHSEMPCGSTIGPALASGLGIDVVDVGVAQLAMHSTREVCGSSDHGRLTRALTAYLSRA